MILARTLFAKLRPKRPTPREVQEQIDVSRAAALTMAYAKRASGIRDGGSETAGDAAGSLGVDRNQLERKAQGLSPEQAKTRVQSALNDQVSWKRRVSNGECCTQVHVVKSRDDRRECLNFQKNQTRGLKKSNSRR